jgi:hypothetical protein
LLVAAAGCSLEYAPPDARTAGADSIPVLDALRAYYRDFSARDWEAFQDHFWPGATITTIWQQPGDDSARVHVSTIDAFVAQAPQGPGSRSIFEESMLSSRIRVTGTLAQAWVRYRARFGDPGDVMEWEGTDAVTLLRHEGRWRIVALVFASDADPS